MFNFGNFETVSNSRQICAGDSGGPVMDFHLGNKTRATLVGVIHGGFHPAISRTPKCPRRVHDASYVGPGPFVPVLVIKPMQAVKVANHLEWIKLTISGTYVATPDALEKVPGVLGNGPEWESGDNQVTQAPPADTVGNILFGPVG